MKGLLGLASDFLDRLANPAYGLETNESYSLRFAEVAERDPEFMPNILELALEAEDVELLTPSGWFWYLDLKSSAGQRMSDSLLNALYDRGRDTFVRFRVLESVVTLSSVNEPFAGLSDELYPLEAYPDSWLAGRLRSAVAEGTEERYRTAEELLLMLIQLGTPASIQAARSLLAHQWAWRDRLREQARGLLSRLVVETDEDAPSRDAWFDRLGLQQ